MPLRIHRKPRAAEDLLEIWEYIAGESLQSADRIVDTLEESFRLLASYPAAGTERPELGAGLRSLPHGRFVIFYRYDDQVIEIVRVVAAARRLSHQLFDD